MTALITAEAAPPSSSIKGTFAAPLPVPLSTNKKYLCLTICGYRKAGMSEEDYRNHMVNVSAPMTKGLMVKYGIQRWTQVNNKYPSHHYSSYSSSRMNCARG